METIKNSNILCHFYVIILLLRLIITQIFCKSHVSRRWLRISSCWEKWLTVLNSVWIYSVEEVDLVTITVKMVNGEYIYVYVWAYSIYRPSLETIAAISLRSYVPTCANLVSCKRHVCPAYFLKRPRPVSYLNTSLDLVCKYYELCFYTQMNSPLKKLTRTIII